MGKTSSREISERTNAGYARLIEIPKSRTDVIGNSRAVIAETGKVLQESPATRLGYFIRIVFTVPAQFYFLFTMTWSLLKKEKRRS